MENVQLTFSGGFITAMLILLLVCCTLPILYFIYYAFKRKINYAALFAAIAGFLVFGYFLNGMLLANIIPEAEIGQGGTTSYALIRSIIAGITNTGGAYICLRLLAKRYDSINTPISFGLGYPLYVMIFEGGANAMPRLAMAYSVNEKGLQAVLDTVDAAERANLREQLEVMASSPLSEYYYSAGKYAAYFIIGVAIIRLLWYSLRGERRPPSWLFIPAAMLLRILLELPIALYTMGVTDNISVTSIIYYAITLIALLASVFVSRLWDENDKVTAGPLNRRLL